MNKKVKTLVLLGAFTAIIFILQLFNIGYFRIGPIEITIVAVPVIIGTYLLGLRGGIVLGFMFGLTSLITALTAPNLLIQTLMADKLFWVKTIPILFIPRLLVPVVAHFSYKLISKNGTKREYRSLTIASSAASLTNTILFLGMMVLLFMNTGAVPLVLAGAVALTNGLPEMVFCAIICPPIYKALNTMEKKNK